jgi:hypothetical protein
VYAATTSGTQIFKVNEAIPNSVATDATYLYVADYQGIGYLNKKTGGTVNRVISTLGNTNSVFVDPNTGNIWAAALANNYVASCTRAGVCSQWTWNNYPAFIAVIGTTPYIVTFGYGIYMCASDTDCSQANAIKVTSEAPTYANFSYDSSYLYFGSGALVQRCPLSGCTSGQNLGSAQGNVVWTATDSTYVYWLTSNGYIQKVAK